MECEDHYAFYKNTVLELIKQGVIDIESKILVVCGGQGDKMALLEAGLKSVVISNLDERMKKSGTNFSPYEWVHEDASSLSFDDNTFDFVFEHSGLHHLKKPQAGLCEMFRVARKGVLLFEPCDSLYSRIGIWMGFGQNYELAAVQDNGRKYGGVENSAIPNYVYRFSKKSLLQTIQSYDPTQTHEIQTWKAFRPNYSRISMLRNPFAKAILFGVLKLISKLNAPFGLIFNNTAFYIKKKGQVFPWLKENNGIYVPNDAYFDTHFS
ncbi:Class I SAM-dependent methyltransferase [Candidatus Magnetomoraceae bacterium gMMP-1]